VGDTFNSSSVKSKTEKLAPIASLVSIHHLSLKAGLVGLVSVTGWGIMFICGMAVQCAGILKPAA